MGFDSDMREIKRPTPSSKTPELRELSSQKE
jgi:hypothetical protein